MGIESTAHTFGVGLSTLEGEILLNLSSTYTTKEGGIHPREAARHHVEVAPEIVRDALSFCSEKKLNICSVAVALGPGLGPCLRVGAVTARALSLKLSVPLIAVNHAVAHIEIARKFTQTKDPVTLYVSGGNTAVVIFAAGRYVVAGETLDISLGNLLDVFARELGYGYPGAPKVLELAQKGKKLVDIPMPIKGQDLSFSGMLTAAKRMLSKGVDVVDLAYTLVEESFAMVTEVTERVLVASGKDEVSLTGGLARSKKLVEMLGKMCEERRAKFSVVPGDLAGDNGAMIAYVGALYYPFKSFIEIEESFVRPRWRIEEVKVPWRTSFSV